MTDICEQVKDDIGLIFMNYCFRISSILLSCLTVSLVFLRFFILKGQHDLLELYRFLTTFSLSLFRDVEAKLLAASLGDRSLEHILHRTT